MIETVLGGLLGFAARSFPELLKFFDRKAERKHELALGKQQMEMAQLQTSTALQQADIALQQSQFVTAFEAMKEGIKAQGQLTGVKIVDAINALIRPAITAWIFSLYSVVKHHHIDMAMKAEGITFAQAVASTWTPSDEAMLAAVITFFFVGRVWDKPKGKV